LVTAFGKFAGSTMPYMLLVGAYSSRAIGHIAKFRRSQVARGVTEAGMEGQGENEQSEGEQAHVSIVGQLVSGEPAATRTSPGCRSRQHLK
jgi:hypothetical protein